MFATAAAWCDVMETCALRRDGVVFVRLLVTVPVVGRAVLHDDDGAKPFLQVQYIYWTRLFDDVTYFVKPNNLKTCVEFTRNGKPHRVDGPAKETIGDEIEWWLHGKRFNRNGVAALTPTYAFYWDGQSLKHVWYDPTLRLKMFSGQKRKFIAYRS